MESHHQITFVVFTYNEEKRIERVIKNFIAFGNILIADGGSTDGTIEIARKYNCDIYLREDFGYGFVENQPLVNRLYEIIKTDWIYWAFADEMLDRESLELLTKIVQENKYQIINIDRKNYFMGKFCYSMFHSRTNKCFKKGAIDFSTNCIHGFGKAVVKSDEIYWLSDAFFVHHFISNDIASYLNVINRYTNEETGKTPSGSVSSALFYIQWRLMKMFWKNYLFLKGYKAGIRGLFFYFLMSFYYIVKYMKLYERANSLSVGQIEILNNRNRDLILEKQ